MEGVGISSPSMVSAPGPGTVTYNSVWHGLRIGIFAAVTGVITAFLVKEIGNNMKGKLNINKHSTLYDKGNEIVSDVTGAISGFIAGFLVNWKYNRHTANAPHGHHLHSFSTSPPPSSNSPECYFTAPSTPSESIP